MKPSETSNLELCNNFNDLPLSIAYLDPEYKIIYANNAFFELVNSGREKIIGKRCYETIGEYAGSSEKIGSEKICSFCRLEDALENKGQVVIERPLGDKVVKVTLIPKMDDRGNISGRIVVIENLTEQRRIQHELSSKEKTYRTLIENSPT